MKKKVAVTLALALAFLAVAGGHAEAARRLPDLIVSSVSAPSSTSSGATIAVSSTIKNQGTYGSNGFSVALYLSTSPSSSTGSALLGTQNVAGLAAGASITLATSLTIPGSTTSGTFYVVAVADSTNAIKERNETNNTGASGAIAVTVPVSTQMTVWVTGALTRVQPTDPPGTAAAAIKAARNEYEAFQVVIRAPDSQPLSNVNVTASDLSGPGIIGRSNITLYREHYVPVRTPSTSTWNGGASPYPPGWWPDALIPPTVPGATYQSFPFSVPAGQNQPALVDVYVPKATPGGTYSGTVTVTAQGTSPVVIPLTLTVWGFTVPDRPALATDFGSYDHNFWIAYQYSAGADHDTLRANLYAALQAHRLGLGVAELDPFTDSLMPRQRAIEVDPGMTDDQLTSMKNHFIANGWGDALDVFPVDEPYTQAQYDTINQMAPRFQALGIPLLTTIENSTAWTALDGSVDIWVPVFYECVYDAAQIPAKLAKGNRVWSYTTWVEPTGVPSWLLDYDLINYRIPAWLNYSHSQTGLLYWTTAYWQVGDPWTNASTVYHYTNGEGVLFYPGDKVGAPNAAIPSLRLKALRDGVEDYDYLALLAQLGDPGLAAQLATALAPAWTTWSHDPSALAAAREQAAMRILQLGGN